MGINIIESEQHRAEIFYWSELMVWYLLIPAFIAIVSLVFCLCLQTESLVMVGSVASSLGVALLILDMGMRVLKTKTVLGLRERVDGVPYLLVPIWVYGGFAMSFGLTLLTSKL